MNSGGWAGLVDVELPLRLLSASLCRPCTPWWLCPGCSGPRRGICREARSKGLRLANIPPCSETAMSYFGRRCAGTFAEEMSWPATEPVRLTAARTRSMQGYRTVRCRRTGETTARSCRRAGKGVSRSTWPGATRQDRCLGARGVIIRSAWTASVARSSTVHCLR